MISKMDSLRGLFTSPSSLLRPILLLALGLHALLLFVPLPQGQEALPQSSKATKTTIPASNSAPKLASKAKLLNSKSKKTLPGVKLKPKAALMASQPPLLLANSKNRSLKTASENGLSATTQSALVVPVPLLNQNSASSGSTALRSAPQEAARSLYELLADLPVPDTMDSAFTNVAKLEDLPSPNLFFKPLTDPDLVPEPLPGLDGSPLLVLGEEPKYFFQTYFEHPLANIFDTVTPIGDYGNGPLYKLSKGGYTVYFSLIAPKGRVGSIVSVWTQDPRTVSR